MMSVCCIPTLRSWQPYLPGKLFSGLLGGGSLSCHTPSPESMTLPLRCSMKYEHYLGPLSLLKKRKLSMLDGDISDDGDTGMADRHYPEAR